MLSVNSWTFIISFLLVFFGFNGVHSWDNDELELFDLVEEINENFYNLLGVEESASSNDIRRAYRKLSLQLHPDKNKEPNAEVKFRQLVAAYEVLKDDSKRAKYNDILLNGLPNWHQPVYYYRQVRKMGLVEMTILLSIILTIGQFLIVWSVYFERRFEKEEVFRSKKKKEKKKAKQRISETGENDVLQAELEQIQKPQLSDLLPCLFVRLVFHLITSLPSLLKLAAEKLKTAVERQKIEDNDDDEDLSVDETVCHQKRKKVNFTETLPSAYESLGPVGQAKESEGIEESLTATAEQPKTSKEPGEWTDSEINLLAKAIVKFPGGTTDRWEKIAQMVGRTVKEVTSKSKELKQAHNRTVDPSQQGITLSRLLNSPAANVILPDDVSERERTEENATVRRRSHPAPKTVDRTLMIAAVQPHRNDQDESTPSTGPAGRCGAAVSDPQFWTQAQQRLLESALIQFPKGSADRWDHVAELIPGKTKDDCIRRCKYLADIVKQKQSQGQTTSSVSSGPSSTS